MAIAIEFENVGKQYRLGRVGTGTLSHDLNRWWQTTILRREDPYLRIGETNDRTTKGSSDYVWALKDINFKVEQGDVVGIIGKNGAGKSTLLKLLSHITAPTTGAIRYNGRIASLLEVGTGFHPEMTARENIYMNGSIMGMTRHEITRKLDEIVDFAGIERYLDTPVKRFSSGMTVRLGFAVAAFLEPEILVVDEVLAVGDAEFQKKAIGKMKDVSQGEGRTVLFVSHNMAAVRSLCNNGIVLRNGMLDYIGSADQSVDYYLTHNSFDECTYKRIVDEHDVDINKEIAFLSVAFENNVRRFSTQDEIVFLLNVKGNRDVDSFRVNTTIWQMDNSPVGSVSSMTSFSIKQGEIKIVRFSIRNHNLASGTYSASFSVGLGNFSNGQRDFDIIQHVLTFEITGFINGEKNLAAVQWDRSWGPIMLPYEQTIIETNEQII